VSDIVDVYHIGRWWETVVAREDYVIIDATFIILKWWGCKENWSHARGVWTV